MDDPIVHVKRNVHDDDLHVLGKMPKNMIISGAKDCTLKSWISNDINNVDELNSYIPNNINYNHWITALQVYDEFCIFGTRAGNLIKWDPYTGNILSEYSISTNSQLNCKVKNYSRICGMQSINDKLYVGLPGVMLEFNEDDLSFENKYPICKNDWVYTLRENNGNIAMVIGEHLRIYKSLSFRKYNKVYNPRIKNQSPKISSIEYLCSNKIVASCFDESVRIFNIEKDSYKRLIGHKGRVWNTIPLSNNQNTVISCADDKTIKFWDIRMNKPCVWTSIKHHGRVSCLIEIDEHKLLSSTCDENPKSCYDKCCFFWRDLRMLVK